MGGLCGITVKCSLVTQKDAGSILSLFQVAALGKMLTRMCLSPSSIIWYRPMGGDALRLGR